MVWLLYLNKGLAVLSLLVYASAAWVAFGPTEVKESYQMQAGGVSVLPTPFAQTNDQYQFIGSGPLLGLNYTPAAASLPDLRCEIVVYGMDERPDADQKYPTVHLGFQGSDTVHSLPSGRRCYLLFDRNRSGYGLSPGNTPTNLWVTVDSSSKDQVEFFVNMLDRSDRIVSTPSSHSRFSLQISTGPRPMRGNWTLGGHPVDNSILARLQTRWFGEDLFLSDHGGEEFCHARGRQRLDFGTGEEVYSCFVNAGECLVWKHERWTHLPAGEESRGLPLLHIKAIKDKLMHLELWDEQGRSHLTLNIMRSRDVWLPKQSKSALRFVGAKTWSQYILQIGDQRVVVSPREWLLFQGGEWRLLRSAAEIDAYVNGALKGELLVLEGLSREDGSQILKGHVYNSSRTETDVFEMPLTAQETAMVSGPPTSRPARNARSAEAVPEMTSEEGVAERDPLLKLPSVMRGLAQEVKEGR